MVPMPSCFIFAHRADNVLNNGLFTWPWSQGALIGLLVSINESHDLYFYELEKYKRITISNRLA